MRKAALVQKVVELGTDLMWKDNEIAALRQRLDQASRRIHACPVCGVRHMRSDVFDEGGESDV